MTVFLDASAMVAIIAHEPEASTFDDRPNWHEKRLTSPLAIWEAVRAVANARGVSFAAARQLVTDLMVVYDINIVSIGEKEAQLAFDAHQSFGRGVHPADLNFGDCFAYACAKLRDIPLLFKGNDFAQTDIRDASLE